MRNDFSCPLKAYLAIELYDKNGDLLYKQKQPVRSFLYNWTKALYGLSYEHCRSQAATLKDTGGTDRAYPNLYNEDWDIFYLRPGEGGANRGLLVGNGTTAVTLDDYNLASKIAHGTGAGQLHYYETNTRHYTDSDRSYLEVSRRFYNESGGDITVSEVGLVFSEQDASNVKYFFLILRDLLDPAVTVANYQTLIVKYIFEFLL